MKAREKLPCCWCRNIDGPYPISSLSYVCRNLVALLIQTLTSFGRKIGWLQLFQDINSVGSGRHQYVEYERLCLRDVQYIHTVDLKAKDGDYLNIPLTNSVDEHINNGHLAAGGVRYSSQSVINSDYRLSQKLKCNMFVLFRRHEYPIRYGHPVNELPLCLPSW